MARSYAQVKVSIWDDEGDFCQLHPYAKLLYIHLISRRDLSLAGHLFIRERRWADACFRGNIDAVTDAMTDLITNRYVIIDSKTGELLVRTFIRHDGGYRNSKMRKAIEGAIGRIESTELSTEAAESLARCVNGDPEPPNPQVEDQSDHSSDDQSEDASDQTTDPTLDLRPAALQPYNTSSSSSDSKSDPPEHDEEEDDLISSAMHIVAEKVAKAHDPADYFAYKQSIREDTTRREDLERLHRHHPTFNAEQLAALHGGRELARVIAMTEPEEEFERHYPDAPYVPTPPKPYEPPPTCKACGKACALVTTTPKLCPAATTDMRPADCAVPITEATIHPIRGATA
jgi:hypothetical protein